MNDPGFFLAVAIAGAISWVLMMLAWYVVLPWLFH